MISDTETSLSPISNPVGDLIVKTMKESQCCWQSGHKRACQTDLSTPREPQQKRNLETC